MRPRFRSDLTCTREEQQGVVFYRIDDPVTRTNFRLYEIEYLIAQKLDGTRTLADVVATIKAEFNFDISDADLLKFVGQLESMGFVVNDDPAAPEGTVASKPASAPGSSPDLLATAPLQVDTAEFSRRMQAGFLHLKQGYVANARDFFLAARELDPANANLAQLISHMLATGDAGKPAEVQFLWNHAKQLFPDQVAAVGPLSEEDLRSATYSSLSKPSHEVAPSQSSAPRTAASSEFAEAEAVQQNDSDAEAFDTDAKVRGRMKGALVAVVLVAVAASALYFFGVFDSALAVTVVEAHEQTLPLYFDDAATALAPGNETWLSFADEGTVAPDVLAEGTKVEKGALLASLVLPPKVKKTLSDAKKGIKTAEAAHTRAAAKVASILEERAAAQAESDKADEMLQRLKPDAVSSRDAATKREFEKWKRAKVKANKALTRLAKKERKPIAAEEKARQRLEKAREKYQSTLSRLSAKLIVAPFSGVVAKTEARPGRPAKRNEKQILLRGTQEIVLTFSLSSGADLQVGGQTFVAVDEGAPIAAKVTSLEGGGDKKTALVSVSDPDGTYAGLPPERFRLVSRMEEGVFKVPRAGVALGDGGNMAKVYSVHEGQAVEHAVEVLSTSAKWVIVRGKTPRFADKMSLISGCTAAPDCMHQISDGRAVQVSP